MDHAELQRWLRQKPFQPFRVVLQDGRQFDITHPRMNQLATSFIKIGIGAPDLQPPTCDHYVLARLKEIDRVEPLLQDASPVAS